MALVQTYMPPRTDRLGLLLRGTGAGFLDARNADGETAYSLIHDLIVHPERPGNLCFNDWGSYLGELALLTDAPIQRLGKDVLSLDVNESLSDIDVAVDVLNYTATRGDEYAKKVLVDEILHGDRWHSILDFAEWIDEAIVLAAQDRMLAEPRLVTTDGDSPLGRMAATTSSAEVRALLEKCRAVAETERAAYLKQYQEREQPAIDTPLGHVLDEIDEDLARRLAKGDHEDTCIWMPGNRWYRLWRQGKRTDVEALVQEALSRSPAAKVLAARVAAHLDPELLLSRLSEFTDGTQVYRLRVFRLIADLEHPDAMSVVSGLANGGSVSERCVALGALAKRGDVASIQRTIELAAATDLQALSDSYDIDLWHDMSSDIAEGLLTLENRDEAEPFVTPASEIYLEACCAYERRDALEFLARWSDDRKHVLEGMFDASDMLIELAATNADPGVERERERLEQLRDDTPRGADAAAAAREALPLAE